MIKKLCILLFLCVLFSYFVAAVTVLNRPKKGLVCSGVEVVVEDSMQTGFISERDVMDMLKSQQCDPTGADMSEVALSRIKAVLCKNPYIEDVTAYKTPGGKVCVLLKQQHPIIHIMPSIGDSYYLDRKGQIMPESSHYADLAVATGNITPQYAQTKLLRLARIVHDDPFWSNQIQQIYVTQNGEVDLIPLVGGHLIQLGEPTDVEGKLDRLKTFYTEGLGKTGWNKYSQINLKYDKQIICKKNKN